MQENYRDLELNSINQILVYVYVNLLDGNINTTKNIMEIHRPFKNVDYK
jgi:hypothetical protein